MPINTMTTGKQGIKTTARVTITAATYTVGKMKSEARARAKIGSSCSRSSISYSRRGCFS
jgi:hypothetical protein